jgi:hypothetical protein
MNQLPIIIGLTGFANSGKDSASEAFFASDADVFAFAKPLKDAAQILFNLNHEQLYNFEDKEKLDIRWNTTPRQIMQLLGDILRNKFGLDFFLINMENRIKNSDKKLIIITDTRFSNEAEFIKKINGKIIQIVRPGANTTVHNNHESEQGISPELIDHIIINDGTIQELQLKFKMIINLLLLDTS